MCEYMFLWGTAGSKRAMAGQWLSHGTVVGVLRPGVGRRAPGIVPRDQATNNCLGRAGHPKGPAHEPQ
jgi:hypothetical protein